MLEGRPARPQGAILKLLKGSVSEPVEVLSQKPATKGETVSVRLAQEGSGMIGLADMADNKEWAGIFNHILKTARVATFLGTELHRRGEQVDPELVLNTVLVSHSGRRQYDEASWYPSGVLNATDKKAAGDTNITLDLLESAGVSPIIIENVRAHGVGTHYPIEQMDTWEKKLALYADFRVSQDVMSLRERFDDLALRAVPAGRVSKDQLDAIEQWAFAVEEEVFSHLDMRPEDTTTDNPRQPRWERYLRRLYINDAEEQIFSTRPEAQPASWWGQIVRYIVEKPTTPYTSRHGKPV